MLLAAIFIILGIGIIAKKSVQISSKRTLSGKKVANLGILFIVTGAMNLVVLAVNNPWLGTLTLLLEAVSVLVVLYLVIFSKGDIAPQPPVS